MSKQLRDLEDKIIDTIVYSAKHIGAWGDDQDRVLKGRLKKRELENMYLNIPALERRIVSLINDHRLDAYLRGREHIENESYIK